MKKLVLVTLLLASGFAKAQSPEYDDLAILYADGNYDKLIRSAESYSQKDDAAKQALPFFWLGRGLYMMSLSGTDEEKYKNAYKEAINAIGKSIKNDKSHEVQDEYSKFYEEFKMSVVTRIQNDLGIEPAGDYKKASAWVLKYYKFDNTNIGAKFLEASCKFRNNDKGGANTAWKDAETRLTALTSTGIDSWGEADAEMLKMGVIETAKCYVSMKQQEKAKTLLGKVKQWYEDDEDFMEEYNAIVN